MPSPTSLIVRLKAGSRSAFQALFLAYRPAVVGLGSRHAGVPARYADGEDLAQCAFNALWREVSAGTQLSQRLTNRESLLRAVGLLVRQEADRSRRHAFQRLRDVRRTVRASELPAGAWGGFTSPAAGPEWEAVFRVALVEALALLTPLQREIVVRKWEGFTNEEVAADLGRAKRSVERQLSEIRTVWAEAGCWSDAAVGLAE